jgi:hypothetical protein
LMKSLGLDYIHIGKGDIGYNNPTVILAPI